MRGRHTSASDWSHMNPVNVNDWCLGISVNKSRRERVFFNLVPIAMQTKTDALQKLPKVAAKDRGSQTHQFENNLGCEITVVVSESG